MSETEWEEAGLEFKARVSRSVEVGLDHQAETLKWENGREKCVSTRMELDAWLDKFEKV